MKDLNRETFATEDEARNFAICANWRIGNMQPTEKDVIGFLRGCFPNCMACNEFGTGGHLMNCGYEWLAPVYDESRGVWRVARERCMIRTWIEILHDEAANPRESGFGTSNELR